MSSGLRWALLAATLPPIAIIVLGEFATRWWVGELCVHWTMHAALCLLPALAVFGRERRWGMWLLILLVLALMPWMQAAYETRAVTPVPAAGGAVVPVRVACANLYDFNPQRALAWRSVTALDCEVLGLSEVKPEDEPLLKGDARWPYQLWTNQRNIFRVGLLSKLPIVWHRLHDLDGCGVVEALLNVGQDQGPLRVVMVHPYSPMSARSVQRRNDQFADLAQLAVARHEPLLMFGDFNCTVAAPIWRAFHAYTGLTRAAGPAPATWPSRLGAFGIGIDHILVRGAGLTALTDFAIPGSDHRGLSAVVQVPVSGF